MARSVREEDKTLTGASSDLLKSRLLGGITPGWKSFAIVGVVSAFLAWNPSIVTSILRALGLPGN